MENTELPSRLLSPRLLRRVLLTLAVLLTVIGLFYTEENWRGKRAWKHFQQKSLARGINPDWEASVPPPVPDDQNFFKAPNMHYWFVGRGETDLSRRINYTRWDEVLLRRGALPFVDVIVMPADAPVAPGDADVVLQYKRPFLTVKNEPVAASPKMPADSKKIHVEISQDALAQLSQSIKPQTNAPPDEPSPELTDVNGRLVTRHSPSVVQPLRVIVRTSDNPGLIEMKQFLPPKVAFLTPDGNGMVLLESNTLRAPLTAAAPYISATEYLAWTDSFKDDFDAMATALDRPYARMDGNYNNPAMMPIPNFITMRLVAQTLAKRAQSYLLLGEPDKALRELTLIHRLCTVLEGHPTSKPMTLVAAMINVAIRGLYVSIVGDGLQMHAWQEPQLIVIQQQLAETDLFPYLYNAVVGESIHSGQYLKTYTPRQFADILYMGNDKHLWAKLHDPVYDFVRIVPRGWLYQSFATHGELAEQFLAAMDVPNHRLNPGQVESVSRYIEEQGQHPGLYHFLLARLFPNYRRAFQVAAHNQTLVNEALIACALERYRLASGHYPETLNTLVPKFVENLPHDLIGGGPLKYRKEGQSFLLYSIGWNEKDDNGLTDGKREKTGDLGKLDWTWPFQDAPAK